ncbi:MAG: hypothetical protein M1820_004131 [Bogoriella megaspora]|nr:MAG: hypothetical protein M1820_004131 [Bogoriella megaspora]
MSVQIASQPTAVRKSNMDAPVINTLSIEHQNDLSKSSLPLGSQRPKTNSLGSSRSRTLVPSTSNRSLRRRTAENQNDVDTLKRAETAPVKTGQVWADEDQDKPRIIRSKSSWLGDRKKRKPATRTDRFPLQFDAFSDSDLSSSSDESLDHNTSHDMKQGQFSTQSDTKEKSKNPSPDSSSEEFDRFNVGNNHFRTKGKVSRRDGRLKISVHETLNRGYLAKALGSGLRHHLDLSGHGKSKTELETNQPEAGTEQASPREPITNGAISTLVSQTIRSPTSADEIDLSSPKLNVVIMVIGSRGDIQPFIKIGKTLRQEYGHRVRIATHPAFKEFIEKDSGLEFFSVGGNPSELMAFMVKNPGLIPSLDTVKQGEIGRRRKAMYEMFNGMWRACINITDNEKDKENIKLMGDKRTFIADAIIANPPSFAHVHIAERLGIPLHMMFTFPYSPTQAFPHPLANIRAGNVDANYTNFMSYPLVELMTWQGLGDLVNKFRIETLGLEPVSTIWAPGQLYRLKVPYTYLWSPSLAPKPPDWGPEIDIGGFVFLELAQSFEPPQELTDFLNAGEPPVYIGFGSIVVDNPDRFTKLIFDAVKQAGVRALVSKGWGGIGGDGHDVPDNILMLGNTPHDWLFPKCSAVVHHGGAGTTAIGLKCAKPTMIVPFFGDQPFWGSMVSRAGAGAKECIPYKKLTTEKLAEGIRQCLTPEAKEKVMEMAKGMEKEGDGATNAVRSFQRQLPMGRKGQQTDMKCELLPERVAVWEVKDRRRRGTRLSALAAELLVQKGKLNWKQLRLIRHYEWNDFGGPGEPITGIGAAVSGTVTGLTEGVGSWPIGMARTMKTRGKHERKKRKVEKKRKMREEQRKAAEKKSQEKQDTAAQQLAGANEQISAVDQQQTTEAMSTSTLDVERSHSQGAIMPPDINAEHAVATQLNKNVNPDGSHVDNRRPISSSHIKTQPERPAPQKADTSSSLSTTLSADPADPLSTEVAHLTTHSAIQTTETLLEMPLDLSLAVAQGFHNAPRLYGDTTVRRPPRITGFHSGLRAARDEFGYGIMDGVRGLITQPNAGWKNGGRPEPATGLCIAADQGKRNENVRLADRVTGAVTGFGRGVGGFVLKDLSAVLSPLAFVAQGVRMEGRKRRQPTGFIRKERVVQGECERKVVVGSEEGIEEVEGKVLRSWEERMENDVGNAKY